MTSQEHKVMEPCPFCGGEARLGNYIVEADVGCGVCGARITRKHAPKEDTGIAEALAAWNRRAPLREGWVSVNRDLNAGQLGRAKRYSQELGLKEGGLNEAQIAQFWRSMLALSAVPFLDGLGSVGSRAEARTPSPSDGQQVCDPPAGGVSEEELQRLAERFCAAPVPDTEAADLCATYEHRTTNRRGTNFLSVAGAKEVLRYVLDGASEGGAK